MARHRQRGRGARHGASQSAAQRTKKARKAKALPPAMVPIEELSPTGEGVGKLDGRAVFVAGTLPGEVAYVEPRGGGVLRGRLLSLAACSEQRVEPSCPHHDACGGCDWMHVAVEAQAEHHVARVQALLGRAFGKAVTIERVHRPDPPLGYRTRARLSAVGTSSGVRVGYRRERSHRVAEVASCGVLHPALDALVPRLASWLVGSEGQGGVTLALGAEERPTLELRWEGELGTGVVGALTGAVAEGSLRGARLWPEGAHQPIDYGDPRGQVLGADRMPMWVAPGGFAQASSRGGAALGARVVELVQVDGPPGRTVELFAGCGTFSVGLAAVAERLEAVEEIGEAVEVLRGNVTSRGLSVKAVAANANERTISPATRTVVLDPPRAGAAGACARILEARPHQIVYVSCDAVTLARDAALLAQGGFVPRELELFELFAQTHHVETVLRLVRG
ncbi:MAG: class I SAM-dependent RNA methyltransferase [Myxococcales bacterium]|nr:class I SAM-dependent RNA methyltransferase [Myxococcales bacterium]